MDYFIVVNCEDPTPINGEVNPPQSDGLYPEDFTVSFTCDDGYNLDGVESSTCLADGSWSPQPPICIEGSLIIRLYWHLNKRPITKILLRICEIIRNF